MEDQQLSAIEIDGINSVNSNSIKYFSSKGLINKFQSLYNKCESLKRQISLMDNVGRDDDFKSINSGNDEQFIKSENLNKIYVFTSIHPEVMRTLYKFMFEEDTHDNSIRPLIELITKNMINDDNNHYSGSDDELASVKLSFEKFNNRIVKSNNAEFINSVIMLYVLTKDSNTNRVI